MVNESHNIKTLQKLPLGRLKKLHREYMGKGTKEAAREASNIKRIIASRMNEEKEVDDEGGMAMGELKSIASNAKEIISMLKPKSQLEGWVQSKITKAADYISTVRDYLSNTPDSISESKQRKRNGEMRILPRADETSGTGKTYETFVSEMSRFGDPHWQPLNASNPEMFDRILAARRKKEDETRANANLANARGFKKLSKKHQERLATAFDPKPTNEALGIPKGAPSSYVSLVTNAEKQKAKIKARAAQKPALKTTKPPKPTNEAVSTGDPNRGKKWRAKPRLPPGQDPYDMYMSSASKSDTNKPAIRPYGGKLKKRLSSLSPESRQRYYREIGMRSRAASRAGTTGRLFPMSEMAQTPGRVQQMDRMLSKPNLTREELNMINATNRKERTSKILFGKGGRKMKKSPSITRGDKFA
jgi:hypothetical protein